jgi:signal transduction histidine kinase
MTLWDSYTATVKRNCIGSIELKNLAYWRNDLFCNTITYMLPFCLIALLPGLIWIFHLEKYMLAIVDLLAVSGILIIAIMPGISLSIRKIIFMGSINMLSCALLYYAGIAGPGLIYLLAACLFSILIIPSKYSFLPAWLNTIICTLFGMAIWFGIVPGESDRQQQTGEWIAISSNVVFLGFLLAALIPKIFNGLEETINKETALKDELSKQQSSLKDALDMLRQKNKELEQFAYVASHDLKEPLRMVTSFMGLLKKRYGNQLDEKADSYIEFAVDGGKRMQLMIDDLLDLSRTGHQNKIKEQVSLHDLLTEAKTNIKNLIEENEAEIIETTSLPVLPVYPADIVRLLQNLLSNAIKFRKKETAPIIRITAKEENSSWLFSIEDNGIGIKENKLEKVFEIFARLHSQEAYKGTGIGLAICKKITETHGGKIWVESAFGAGSVFYFRLKKEEQTLKPQ